MFCSILRNIETGQQRWERITTFLAGIYSLFKRYVSHTLDGCMLIEKVGKQLVWQLF